MVTAAQWLDRLEWSGPEGAGYPSAVIAGWAGLPLACRDFLISCWAVRRWSNSEPSRVRIAYEAGFDAADDEWGGEQ